MCPIRETYCLILVDCCYRIRDGGGGGDDGDGERGDGVESAKRLTRLIGARCDENGRADSEGEFDVWKGIVGGGGGKCDSGLFAAGVDRESSSSSSSPRLSSSTLSMHSRLFVFSDSTSADVMDVERPERGSGCFRLAISDADNLFMRGPWPWLEGIEKWFDLGKFVVVVVCPLTGKVQSAKACCCVEEGL